MLNAAYISLDSNRSDPRNSSDLLKAPVRFLSDSCQFKKESEKSKMFCAEANNNGGDDNNGGDENKNIACYVSRRALPTGKKYYR